MASTDINDGPPRRATIEDVASGAGVSVATVSRALRNLPNVADSTRQRVSDVAARLSYRPDPAAARLAAGRTGTVTVAVPSLNGWYFSTVVAGAEAVCADAGLEFQVIGIASPLQRDRLLDDAHSIERRTDGLILIDITVSAEQAASLARRRVTLATVGSRLDGHPWVAIDDEHVGAIAAEHLIGLGHRSIAVIGGVDGPMNFDVPLRRRRGFERAAAEHHVVVPERWFTNGNFDVQGGYEAMTSLLDSVERPTAVFAMSDEMAFGALMALDEHGLQPGVDLSIIGVDDHEFAQVVRLTTIRQPVADHGSTAALMLIAAMKDALGTPFCGPELPISTEIQPTVYLVERATTGPPDRHR